MGIPAIHQELGKFIVLFQTMDSAINDLIISIADKKHFVAEAFIAKTEFTAKMDVADVIFTHFVDITANTDKTEKENFRSLIKECKTIGQERNVIVHSVYYPLTKADGTKRLIQQNPRLKFKSSSQIVINDNELAIDDFTKINEKISEALKEIERFRLKLIDWEYPNIKRNLP